MDSIKVLPFKFKHYISLVDVMDNKIPYKNLPKIGYIAIRNKKIIAACFLRKVEGSIVCHLDTIVYNRYIGGKLADIGIQKVLEAVLNEAKDLKLQQIIVPDQYNDILKRLELTKVHISIGVSYTYALGF